jgi:predicted transcriptional regulator
MNNELIKLANELARLYEEAYLTYEPLVNGIIDNKIRDINYIENIIDHVMDIYTEKGFYLCVKLIIYFSSINYNNAQEYLKILKEQRFDEYSELIDKIMKSDKRLKKE